MIRTLNIIMVCTSLAGLIGIYTLKYAVEETASARAALERQIEAQESELSLLQADWAYLNQPAHVAPIVVRVVRDKIRVLQGDRVTLSLSPYDLSRGRITYRHK